MDHKQKAVEVHLEEYKALRREIDLNLQVEGNAINWSILLIGALLTFIGSGKPAVDPQVKGLLLAVLPLMFTGLYMMLCKRHRNSRSISRYIIRHLSERLRRLGIPYVLTWDVDKLHEPSTKRTDADTTARDLPNDSSAPRKSVRICVAGFLGSIARQLDSRWVCVYATSKSMCQARPCVSKNGRIAYIGASLIALGLLTSIASLTLPKFVPLLLALAGVAAAVRSLTPPIGTAAETWQSLANHLYRWLTTSALPGLGCTLLFCMICTGRGCLIGWIGISLLALNLFLSLCQLLMAVLTDADHGLCMRENEWRLTQVLPPDF